MIENLTPHCFLYLSHDRWHVVSINKNSDSHGMKAKRNLNDKKQPAEYRFSFETARLTIPVPGMWMSADPNGNPSAVP